MSEPEDASPVKTAPTKTVEEVLKEVRFQDRIEEIELRLPATLVLAKEGSLAKRNQVRRKLYRDSELIRIEIEEKLNEYAIESEWLTSPAVLEANKRLDAVRKQLQLDILPSSNSQFEKAYMFVRFATFALVLVGWFSAICILIPIRLLDSTLRKQGVPRNYLPMEVISWFMARVFCFTAGSDARVEGAENLTNLKDSVVCMFSHASNLDGFLVNGMSPVAFKYAGKKSLFMLPFLGWTSRWGFGYVAIDRSNRKKALASLKELAVSVNENGNSVSISPEGTRSKDGLLQEFKKGPFYLRDDTKKNVVPAIIFGAYESWPPGRVFASPAKTLVRFLPEFVPDAAKNRNQNRLALRRIYLDAFAEDVPDDIGTATSHHKLLLNMVGIYLIWCVTIKVTLASISFISSLCFFIGISWWTFTKLALLVTVGLELLMFFTC